MELLRQSVVALWWKLAHSWQPLLPVRAEAAGTVLCWAPIKAGGAKAGETVQHLSREWKVSEQLGWKKSSSTSQRQ